MNSRHKGGIATAITVAVIVGMTLYLSAHRSRSDASSTTQPTATQSQSFSTRSSSAQPRPSPTKSASTVPSQGASMKTANNKLLAEQVVKFLQAYYLELPTDTHATRLARVEKVQPQADKGLYGMLDLSVNTTSPDNQTRVQNGLTIQGVVQNKLMTTRVITLKDVYVFAPVFVTIDGTHGTLVKTGSTWLYKSGNWVISSFNEGADS